MTRDVLPRKVNSEFPCTYILSLQSYIRKMQKYCNKTSTLSFFIIYLILYLPLDD
jgi:hypothetical protein